MHFPAVHIPTVCIFPLAPVYPMQVVQLQAELAGEKQKAATGNTAQYVVMLSKDFE